MTSALKKLRRSLLLWHRRVGAVIAAFLLMLAVTGILLNHTEQLQLAEQPVNSDWWLSQYGLQRPEVTSYRVGDAWLSHLGGNYAYLNEREVGYCETPLSGAVAFTEMIVVACDQVLLLLTPSGDVIERVDHSYGLTEGGLQGLAVAGETLLVQVADQWFQADMMSMQFSPYSLAAIAVSSQALPDSLEQQLLLNFRGEDIHWERLLLDLHSGRLFGLSGVVWMDLVALMLIWVAGTGVWVWATRPRR